MKTLYLDCFAGISGDMFIAALIDLGLDPDALAAELRKLPLEGYRLQFERVSKRGIAAVQFKVILSGAQGERLADSGFQEVAGPEDVQPDPAAHVPAHDHPHHQPPEEQQPDPFVEVLDPDHHPSAEADHDHRSLAEILGLIEASELSAGVKDLAGRAFNRLAEAEGRVHGVAKDAVHFHEVGGTDAILDIVGSAVGLEKLGIDRVLASPLHLGSGFVRSAHGLLPVPAPATAHLLLGVPVYTSEVRGELVTPTGAAILTTIAQGYGPLPLMQAEAVGYGAGSREREFPNVLRATLGEELQGPAAQAGIGKIRGGRDPFPEQHRVEPGPAGYHEGPATVIEANIDDMNPQLFEHLTGRLLEAGALDVLLIPAQMKKGRPGMLLHVLAYPPSLDDLLGVIFTESTSIGVRTYEVTKRMLQRELREVQTAYGPVRVKVARLGKRVVNFSPEYEDCRALAERLSVPLKDVYAEALAGAGRLFGW